MIEESTPRRPAAANDLPRRWAWFLLLAIALLGVALRLAHFGVSLWFDEIETYLVANKSVPDILRTHVYPLYYILAKAALWCGGGDISIRVPSLIAGLTGIVAMYCLGAVYNRTAGVFAALMVCASPYHLYYSQDARFYAVMVLCAILALLSLYRAAMEPSWKSWACYSLAGAAGVCNHLSFAPFLGALYAGYLALLVFSRAAGGWRARLRRGAIASLCTAIAFSYAGAYVLNTGISRFFSAPESGLAAAATSPAPSGEKPVFRLTPSFYQQTLTSFLDGDRCAVRQIGRLYYGLFIVLAAAGWLALWRERRALAALATAAAALVPLVLFLVPFPQKIYGRYFIAQLPVVYLFAAVGVASLAQALARMQRAGDGAGAFSSFLPKWLRSRRTAAVWTAIVVSIALLVPAPYIAKRIALHYAYNRPFHDWKNAARHIAVEARPGDRLAFLPWVNDWKIMSVLPLETYLGYWRPEEKDRFRTLCRAAEGVQHVAPLERCAWRNPEDTLWIADELSARNLLLTPAEIRWLEACFPSVEPYRGALTLRCLPEPTANLLPGGDLSNPSGLALRNEAALDTDSIPRQVRLGQGGEIVLPIAPDSFRLRNAGFDAWANRRPVGWDVSPDNAVTQPAETPETNSALRIKTGNEPVRLRQSIPVNSFPGAVFQLAASGKADAPEHLSLILEIPGVDGPQRIVRFHSGNGAWETLTAQGEWPAGVSSGTLAIEIVCAENACVFADSVALTSEGAASILTQSGDYTLSFRCTGEGGRSSSKALRVALLGTAADGAPFQTGLVRVERDFPENLPAYSLRPGRDAPADRAGLSIAVTNTGAGEMCLTEFQLEAKPYATAFTRGVRPPHDEFLAVAGIAPGAPNLLSNGGFEAWDALEANPQGFVAPTFGSRIARETVFVSEGNSAVRQEWQAPDDHHPLYGDNVIFAQFHAPLKTVSADTAYRLRVDAMNQSGLTAVIAAWQVTRWERDAPKVKCLTPALIAVPPHSEFAEYAGNFATLPGPLLGVVLSVSAAGDDFPASGPVVWDRWRLTRLEPH